MDAFTEIISVSQKWEQRLERDYGAVGRGLHEKISSVESRLPEATVRKLRYIATIRNKATHENVAQTRGTLKRRKNGSPARRKF